jgi:hypothetical protein
MRRRAIAGVAQAQLEADAIAAGPGDAGSDPAIRPRVAGIGDQRLDGAHDDLVGHLR